MYTIFFNNKKEDKRVFQWKNKLYLCTNLKQQPRRSLSANICIITFAQKNIIFLFLYSVLTIALENHETCTYSVSDHGKFHFTQFM